MSDFVIESKALVGRHVALEPIAERHREGLRRASDNQDIWTYIPMPVIGDAFDAWFDWSVDISGDGRNLVYAVRRLADDRIVGSTRFMMIEAAHARAEIGFTWYEPSAQATSVNPECKLLLFEHAFEKAGAIRVELKTDSRNARSRAAIIKLGAREEGVLRQHMRLPDSHRRDSVYFSVLDHEWPDVKEGLVRRLA